MDAHGNIWTEEEMKAWSAAEKKARDPIPIPAEQVPRVGKMNRTARRAWHAKRKAERLAQRQARKTNR